jgi:undecaprenyl-diphosphatase
MSAIQALILGIAQGLGEFLPISSSGHLVLLQRLFGIGEGALSFDIVVHFGTLISLCAVMRKRLLELLRDPFGHVPRMVALGTVPTVIIAFVFGGFFKELFDTGISLGFGFLFTAATLYIAENHYKKAERGGIAGDGLAGGADGVRRLPLNDKNITPRGALIVGIAQGIAVTPAVSRSGSTIAAGIVCEFGRREAIEFAFLLSIPVTLMAVAQDFLKMALGANSGAIEGVNAANAASAAGALSAAGPLEMAIGFAASAVTGYFSARFMLGIIGKIKLSWFSAYVGLLGLSILCDQLFFGVVFDKFF